jgi:hypothetical protein
MFLHNACGHHKETEQSLAMASLYTDNPHKDLPALCPVDPVLLAVYHSDILLAQCPS